MTMKIFQADRFGQPEILNPYNPIHSIGEVIYLSSY